MGKCTGIPGLPVFPMNRLIILLIRKRDIYRQLQRTAH
ncbi:hypothetical protein GEOBRER4_n2112 [Citrifermentans bremense]|uniref:Uncharacterized protein n=1 Tax=Citrifermentans bremense TaxID=60035 RepID=A0A7R7FT61_9BACT|nr:hypothetical protein GEOBRER4_n2112 [Citrifermentans bremense]